VSVKKTPSSRHRFPSDALGLPKAMHVASAEQSLHRQKKRSLHEVNACAEHGRSKHFSDKCNEEIGVFLQTLYNINNFFLLVFDKIVTVRINIS
jgi:hypothetical protein